MHLSYGMELINSHPDMDSNIIDFLGLYRVYISNSAHCIGSQVPMQQIKWYQYQE